MKKHLIEEMLFEETHLDNRRTGVLGNICSVLNCKLEDIHDISAIKSGLTNTSFKFEVGDQAYVYRHPGVGTENYISRQSEAFSMDKASELGLDDTFIAMDPVKGWKVSRYVNHAREMNYHVRWEVEHALKMMRVLHDSRIESAYDFGIWGKTLEFIDKLKEAGQDKSKDFYELFDLMEKVYKSVADDEYAAKCLCHNDCYYPNFLLDDDNRIYLIDWEYSGNDDPGSDLGTFICCSDYNEQEVMEVISMYRGHKCEGAELKHFLGYTAVAAYYWYVWAIYQEYVDNSTGEWLNLWHKNSRLYAEKTMAL